MEYVLTENGNIKVKDGHPLVKGDDGKEHTIDAIGANDRITSLNSEAAKYRKKASQLSKEMESFSGIEDPAAAIEALTTVKNLGEDHKVKMDQLKDSLSNSYSSAAAEKDNTIKQLQDNLFDLKVTNKFTTSPIIAKTTLPADIAAQFFKSNFDKDGNALDSAGNTIFSKTDPGKPAKFDEAVEVLINAHPQKDSIWKTEVKPGSGGHQTGGSGDNSGPGEGNSLSKIAQGLKDRGMGA